DDFNEKIAKMISLVSHASQQLVNTSEYLNQIVNNANQKSNKVAELSNKANENVNAIVKATSLLNDTSTNISEQVQNSTQVVSDAVSKTTNGDQIAQALSDSTSR